MQFCPFKIELAVVELKHDIIIDVDFYPCTMSAF